LTSGDESLDLVTNWIVESRSFSEKFENYNSALSKFDNLYKGGEHVILYEIKIDPLSGSTVKKVPLLNSKRTNAHSNKIKSKSESKSRPNIKAKIKFHDFKMRLLLLGIVFIIFLIVIYVMNVMSSGNPEVGGITHFIIAFYPLNCEFLPRL
jgi:hypothetical protein